jgi:hypothetical protein
MREIPSILTTLPVGATIEFEPLPREEDIVHVTWKGEHYSVFLQDLLSACQIEDVGRFGWP